MEIGVLMVTWLDGSEDEFGGYRFSCVPRTGDFLQVTDMDFGAVVTRVTLWVEKSPRVPSFTVEAHEVCDVCDKTDCDQVHGVIMPEPVAAEKEGG